MAQRFDAGKLETAGQPVPVAEKVSGNPNGIISHFSVSLGSIGKGNLGEPSVRRAHIGRSRSRCTAGVRR